MRQFVVFDTNAYRELFHGKNLNECIEIVRNIRKRELDLDIHAFITPIVWLELFMHLADFNDDAFEICINSICGSYLHTRAHSDNMQYQIFADADVMIAESLFNCKFEKTYELYDYMDFIAGEVYKNPNRETIKKHIDFFVKAKSAVEKEEEKFRNNYNELFNSEIKDSFQDDNNRDKAKGRLKSKKHFNSLALIEVVKAIKYANIDTSQFTESDYIKHIEFVKEYFSAPLYLGNEILRDGLLQQDLDINQDNRVNWCWDYKILCYISKSKPILLITRDKAMTRAADSAGLREKVKNIEEYKMMIKL